MKVIKFNGKSYPIREITINNKELKIGTMSLLDTLYPPRKSPTPEAEDIDSTIFVYVEDNEINLKNEEFKEAVLNACQLEEGEI